MPLLKGASAAREEGIRRTVLLSILYASAGCLAMLTPGVLDPDIWWHLRTGQWIVQHHAVPFTDPFSAFGAGKPWAAYSWFFELIAYGLFRAFDLFGILLLQIVVLVAIAIALHSLIRKFEPNFTKSVALTAVGIVAMASLKGPRPWLFTILFFILEMRILLSAQATASKRQLLWLVPLFALWANFHIQFVYGLFVLVLATLEPWIVRNLKAKIPNLATHEIPGKYLALVTVGCGFATLITPYHLYLYKVIYGLTRQTGALQWVQELQAPAFREINHFVMLFAVLTAAFVLGRQREIRPFFYLLLLSAAAISFRSERDIWFVAVVSVSLIAFYPSDKQAPRYNPGLVSCFAVGAGTVLVLIVMTSARHISNSSLAELLAKTYPVDAAASVEQHGYAGPVYNGYNWGGYIIWRLPKLQPSMDSRQNVYGDARIERSINTWMGKRDWASDQDLLAARLVIAPVDEPLASLLRIDPNFKLVYEDAVAAVFVRSAGKVAPNLGPGSPLMPQTTTLRR